MSKWTSQNVPNENGRVAIVTGANSGIGYKVVAAKLWEVSEQLTGVKFEFKQGELARA